MSFAELGLSPLILRAVEELGYREPTPIQRQAIPVVLAGEISSLRHKREQVKQRHSPCPF